MMPSASNINNKKPEKRASVSSTISGIGSGNPIVNNIINNTVEIMKKSNNSISNGSNGTTNATNNNNPNKASKEKTLNAAAGVISGTNNNCPTATGSAPSITGSVTGANANNPATSSNSGSSTNNPSSNNNNDPLKMALVAIEHKIRNLEKRKTKLESYRAIQANGKELSTDQRNAVAKYDSVMATLEFARDFAKQMTQFAKDAEKEQKKQARKDVIAKAHAETAKIREVIVIQNILSCFSEDVVRTDFLNGLNGAIKLEADEMESLEKFCIDIQARRPENSEEPDFVTQAQKAAELFSMTIDARPKAYGSTTFEKLRSTFGQIQDCGYLDKIYMDEVSEIEVGGSGDASLERAKQEIADSLECLEKGLNSVKLSNETGHLGEVVKDVNVLQGGAVVTGNVSLTPSAALAGGNVTGMQQIEGALYTQGPAGLVGSGPALNVGQLAGTTNPTVVVPGGLVGATITAEGKQQQILINPVAGAALPQNGQPSAGIPIQGTNLHYAPVTVDAVEQAFKHQHHHHHQQQQPQQHQHLQQQHLQQHHQQKQQMQQQYLQMRPLAEVIGSGSFFFLQDSELDSPETVTGGVLPPAAAAVASGAVLPPPGVSQQPHQQPPLPSMINVNQKVVVGEQKIQDPLDPTKMLTMSSLDPINPLRNDSQQQATLQQKTTHPVTAQGINSQTFTNQSFPQTQQKPQIQQQQQQQQQPAQQSQNQKLQQQVAQIGQATAAAVAAANASVSLSGKKTPVSFNDPQQQQNSIFQKQQTTSQHSHQQQQLFTSPVSFAQIQKQQQQQQQQQQHQQQLNSTDPQSQQQPMMILSRLAAPQARHPSQNQQSNTQQSQQQQLHHHQQKTQSQGLNVAGGSSGSGGVLNHPTVSDTASSSTASAGSNKAPSSVTGFFDTLVYEQQIQLVAKLNAAAANVEKVAMENVASNANERDSNMKQSKNSMGSVLPDALSENSNAFDPLKWTSASLTPNSNSNPSNAGNHLRKNDWASTAAGYNDTQTPGNENSNHWGPQNDNISPYARSGNTGSSGSSTALRSSNNYPRRSDDQRGNSGGRPGTNNGNGNGGYRNRNNNYGGGNNNGPQTNGGRTMLYRNDPTSVGNSSYYQNGGGGGGNGVYGKDNGPRYDAGGSYRGPRGGGMNSNNGNGGGPVGNGNGRGGNGPNRGIGGGRSGNNPNNSTAAYMRQAARITLGLDTKN